MTFIKSNWYGGSVPGYAWHTSKSAKGLYDPCPVGYRVPDGDENGFWATALGTSSQTNVSSWLLADGTTVAWYPKAGKRDYSSGELKSVGTHCAYWSAPPYNPSSNGYYAYVLYIDPGYVYPAYRWERGSGNPVRCMKE